MSHRRKSNDTLPFDTITLEGSLFVPELLERAARGEAGFQKETDYAIPKGLKLHDEYGRAFRIATASWEAFVPQTGRTDLNAAAVTCSFVIDLLRQCFGYTDLAAQDQPLTLGDRGFPVTALALGGRLPVIIAPHSLGLDDPDPRFAIIGSGAKKKSAHQLAQEFLNTSQECLWAIVTNGRTLRLLRDADTLTRPNFLEFDLETILRDDQQRYADFSALWRILHASRAGEPASPPAECIWEKWKSEGHAQGVRVRNGLRDGVTQAILILGSGFIRNPENDALRQRLHDGTLTKDAYFQQLLRLIYRCLFLFCAEERDLLHAPDSTVAARQAYAAGYAIRRFRTRSLRQSAHDPHGDLWISTRIVFRALASGQEKLALPALGGLFADDQCPDLDTASLANRDLLAAMRDLRWFFGKKSGKRSAIDYRNMGPEELGSVYESLLELVPTIDLPVREFGFVGITTGGSTSGNARKTTGSYYTPDSLVQELIKSALDPVIADRLKENPERPVEALLSITVCDPSCGSGHFLLAAARRLAERLAELRAPEGAVRPDDYRHALREVASRCLYGVDINPMAVELCRVALWLETVDPGKPLGFLDHHIRSGNSLLGTTPDLIAAGLPDETFTAIEGDDKKACAELKKRNKKEREGFGPLFAKEENDIREKLRQAASAIEDMDDSRPDLLDRKAAAFATSESSPEHHHAKQLADLWCAAFVIRKIWSDDTPVVASPSPIPSPEDGQLLHSDNDLFGQPVPSAKPTAKPKKQRLTDQDSLGTPVGITTGTLRDFVQGQSLPTDLESEAAKLASQYRFFHWYLAFPQVFEKGGFDCILGNPPWERVNLKEQEWFAERRPEIANAENSAARKRLIEIMRHEDPTLYLQFEGALRQADGEGNMIRSTGRYPLCGRGDINLYAVFAEAVRNLLSERGRAGCVLPSGISTDDTTKFYFQDVVEKGSLISLFDFENKGIFPGVHNSYKFCLFTTGSPRSRACDLSEFVFFAHSTEDLVDPTRRFTLDSTEITALNPNSRTCPIFRSTSDAEITKAVYRNTKSILLPEQTNEPADRWPIDIGRMFHTSDDSPLFTSVPTPQAVRLYEAKCFAQFDHRYAAFSDQDYREVAEHERSNPDFFIPVRYYIEPFQIPEKFKGKLAKWHLSFRKIARATDSRTLILSITPHSGLLDSGNNVYGRDASAASLLIGQLNSFIVDYISRQKIGGPNMTVGVISQLPVIPPTSYAQPCPWAENEKFYTPNPQSFREWLLPRVLELTYTAWDLEAFAQDCGWQGPPFRWDEERRFLLRCELDAAFFRLYLGSEDEWRQQPETLTRAFHTPRHAVSYIMDTFPIVKRKDEAKHGSYRTKDTILEIYDALAESIESGTAYQSRLSVPPAGILATHDPKWPTTVRPALEASDYFMYLLPLMARLEPGGVETGRLFRALEILTDRSARKKIADGDEFPARWSASLPKTSFSDGAAALLAWLRAGNLQGVHRIGLAPAAQVPVEDPWLQMDAFMALKLAIQSPLEVIRATEAKHQSIMEDITRLSA